MITLHCIVKNEEKTLPTCLKSIRDWVDGIVIVDTGSTDSTCDIARSYNADVRVFEWCDDFGAARNFALSHVKTPWTIWLDADDLVLNPQVIKHWCELARKQRINALWSTYLQDAACYQRRLQIFKTKDFSWQGYVHENPIAKNQALALHEFTDLKVEHRKPKGRTKEAAQKYLDILLKKDPENWLGIAESYKLLGEKQQAEAAYFKAAFHPKANDGTRYIAMFMAAKYCLELAVETKDTQRLKEGFQMTEAAHKLLPHRAEAIVLAGQIADALGQKEDAKACYEEALSLKKPDDEIGVIFHAYYDDIPKQLLKSLT
jgi:glycosyltransferase involved in cell wall biosynthesis